MLKMLINFFFLSSVTYSGVIEFDGLIFVFQLAYLYFIPIKNYELLNVEAIWFQNK